MRKCNLFLLVLFFLYSCEKGQFPRLNKIKNYGIEFQDNNFFLRGTIIDKSVEEIVQYGHCWSLDKDPNLNNSSFTLFPNGESGMEFKSKLFNIEIGKHYFFTTFSISKKDTTYFAIESFIIDVADIIEKKIAIDTINSINSSSVSVTSNLQDFSQFKIQQHGICWSDIDIQPQLGVNQSTNNNAIASYLYNESINGLQKNKNYYFRSYLKLNQNNVIYSESKEYLIPDFKVSTLGFQVNGSNAVLQGKIDELGADPINNHGFCWATTTSNPDFNNNRIELGSINQIANFSNSFSMESNTTYFFRAFARSGNELRYGDVIKIVF